MKSCWRWSVDSRPSLKELQSRLETAARTADDKAVLQVPELVVPELYAAVAGISMESLSYSYSILWRSQGRKNLQTIIYSRNQFLQEQRIDLLVWDIMGETAMDPGFSPTHTPRCLKWYRMRVYTLYTLETEKYSLIYAPSFIFAAPILKTQRRCAGWGHGKGGLRNPQCLLQHGTSQVVSPTTGWFLPEAWLYLDYYKVQRNWNQTKEQKADEVGKKENNRFCLLRSIDVGQGHPSKRRWRKEIKVFSPGPFMQGWRRTMKENFWVSLGYR